MPCNHPLPAWRAREPNPASGKVGATFTFREADTSQPLQLPCGRCIGCRLERANQWATRLMNESRLHRHNWFLTLTYDDAHLPRLDGEPPLPTLRPRDMVLFLKRLRKAHPGLRYYQCGEYGDTTKRPHHHAIIFNLHLGDLAQLTRARNSHTLYDSATIRGAWKNGHISVGAVTYETAAYVAAYVTKKITGPLAADHYRGRVPEYSTMSRRPGIGAGYFDTYHQEIYPADELIVRGHKMKPPRYYDTKLQRSDPDLYQEVIDNRNANRRQTTHRERTAKELTAGQRLKTREPTP